MFVNDPIHGFIELNELQSSLLELPELQRLQWIKQLGLSFLSYPGGAHTRACHVIGVSHVAGLMADTLDLLPEQKWMVQAAGMLHDVGHTPFSHALESLLPEDHMELTRNLITGQARYTFPRAGWIPEMLRRYGLDPEEVGDLVTGDHPDPILQHVIHGPIDADQLDYLLRDSYFTGIAHGNIDLYRILHTLKPDRGIGGLILLEKGIDAIEEMLVARDHMYSAVYAHRTGRIAETMLLRAMELAVSSIEGWYEMSDNIAAHSTGIKAHLIRLYFIFAVSFGGIVILSLLNAVFVDEMSHDIAARTEDEVEEISEEVEEIDVKLERLSHKLICKLDEINERLDRLEGKQE